MNSARIPKSEPALHPSPPEPIPSPSPPTALGTSGATTTTLRRRAKLFFLALAGLLIGFALPLRDLFQLSLQNELYSHVLLVPCISGYLVWLDKHRLPAAFEPAPRLAAGLLTSGLALMAAYWIGLANGWQPGVNDRLSILILSLVFCFAAASAWFFGSRIMRTTAFPLAFLLFMVPLPLPVEDALVSILQHASADAAYLLLKLSGMSVLREGTQFNLPGVAIAVAPECSGIRSSLVLFMTGLLAAQFFLRRPWSKITLALVMLPLGVFRNALRIFTLAQLAVQVNPDVLNSSLHHHGGPLFFAISLVPFFLLLWLLRKLEK